MKALGIWNGCMQVPHELASLTTLTMLDLLWNSASREGPMSVYAKGLVPKMRVTEQNCRFLLQFPALAALHLDVTQEEKAALAGFLADLQTGKDCACIVTFRLTEKWVVEMRC